MTQNIFSTGMEVAQGLQGLQDARYNSDMTKMQNDQAIQAQQAQAANQQRIGEMKQAYADSGDPQVMRQIIAEDTELAGQLMEKFDLMDDARKSQAINQAGSLKRMIEQNPEQANQYFQQNLINDPAFAELADNFAAGDYEGAVNELGWGVTLAGGEQAYQSMFGGGEDRTDFASDLIAAGIAPGSQGFKDAVLEKYGKGDTIGYDVIEAVNPESGKNEFFQVSRVNPSERIPLGLEVPMTASEAKSLQQASDAMESEKETLNNTLSTVTKILQSPGLSGFSGLDQFRSLVPGSEASNVASYIEQLQSQNFLTAVDQMKGMGALSENEGKKLSGSVAAINKNMSDEAIQKELRSIETDLIKALERMESGNLLTPGTEGQDAPVKTISWSDM